MGHRKRKKFIAINAYTKQQENVIKGKDYLCNKR